jgi:transposase
MPLELLFLLEVIMAKPKLYNSRIWLERKFIKEGMSIADIAKLAGASEMSIRRALQKEGFLR